MTSMIYRGITHDTNSDTPQRVAEDLIYRGIAHDGLSQTAASPADDTLMVYRGYVHSPQGAGAHAETGPLTLFSGQPRHASADTLLV